MLPSVNRKRFFDGYRAEFGRLIDAQVDALEFLLGELERDPLVTDPRHAAYMLATVAWETARTFEPIDERGSEAYFNRRYGPQTATGKRLGNTEPGDGERYHGRGFVQLTGRANYERAGEKLGVDLVAHPARAKDAATAYGVMSFGMHRGWFTGKKLTDFINGGRADYKGARRIINGQDQAEVIAGLARGFETILKSAADESPAAPAAAPVVADDAARDENGASGGPISTDGPLVENAGTVVNTAPASPAAPAGDPPAVPPVKANRQGLMQKITTWAGGSFGVGWLLDQLGKLNGISISPEVLRILLIGVICFGVIGAIAAIIDHLQTKAYRADLNKGNVK